MIIRIKVRRKFFNKVLFRLGGIFIKIFTKTGRTPKDTPLIINNFNRLEYLKQLLAWLEKAGMKRVFILDNASSYPPLLEFYRNCKYPAFILDENVGHTAFWDTNFALLFKNQHYILSDPDVVPIEECPLNVIEYFYKLLDKYPEITKVGFGLKIDDLPDHYSRKKEVVEWEKQFWKEEIEPGVYKADIDTTFALYRPNTWYQQKGKTLRTGYPFFMKHLPWYINDENLNQEENFFRKTASKKSSWLDKERYGL